MFASGLKLAAGLVFLSLAVALGALVLVPLLPWRVARIRVTNHLGHLVGRALIRITGCSVAVTGREHVTTARPAIYVGNHTSILDAFTSIWLAPSGTVGIAKKEIIYYPFYGLAWLLAGHLTIDRGDPEKARASLRSLGRFVAKESLHVFMWPEGTRSRDGRLLPFKKGIIHLAIQTGLPIVPMVTVGAHRAWEKSRLRLERVPIHIAFLPAVDTSAWCEERLEEHLAELHTRFVNALPPDQRPLQTERVAA